MKKILVIALAVITVLIALSSCGSYEACATYSNSSLKQYGPKYKYANAPQASVKKVKKNKIW